MKPLLRWLSKRVRSLSDLTFDLAGRINDLANWLHDQSCTPDLSMPRYEVQVDFHWHGVMATPENVEAPWVDDTHEMEYREANHRDKQRLRDIRENGWIED